MLSLPEETDPNLLVGRGSADDAGVYRVRDDLALIQTVDFLTPIVDDPYQFGRIAAANALSDVYAMGGRALTAMNIVCFPVEKFPMEVLKDILRGGLETIHEAGTVLVGGHSVDDLELKYGLSVTGVVHPDRVITNAGARPGDGLILTKPLGTGVLATAVKGGLASAEAAAYGVEVMATLNRAAAEVMERYDVHAATDITGFGLLGHALEMARASRVVLRIESATVPLLPEILDYASMGMIPAGTYENRRFCDQRVRVDGAVDALLLDLLADAQTSGGLLIAVGESQVEALLSDLRAAGVEHAARVGAVESAGDGAIRVV
ncbi:selenophosphate synthase [Desulfacinum hydrothermale DSM 13146]|uniref:Selenide, water dikinase n=1 Tax=Desulfacinum hydrothermale DSM 13146 TaxID=1121390 RepID=A0A1W1XB00_9BACT|nr:selenophosphate synthase [Desulfacinum hydrothermale DSM 13146]